MEKAPLLAFPGHVFPLADLLELAFKKEQLSGMGSNMDNPKILAFSVKTDLLIIFLRIADNQHPRESQAARIP